MFRERVHVDHAAQHRATAVARLREHQIIDHALAQAAARNQEVLHLFQPVQMDFQLRILPA